MWLRRHPDGTSKRRFDRIPIVDAWASEDNASLRAP
jgi:hypothetical protein